jgi:hypothetical protein
MKRFVYSNTIGYKTNRIAEIFIALLVVIVTIQDERFIEDLTHYPNDLYIANVRERIQ